MRVASHDDCTSTPRLPEVIAGAAAGAGAGENNEIVK
jgi:hypothetical protein